MCVIFIPWHDTVLHIQDKILRSDNPEIWNFHYEFITLVLKNIAHTVFKLILEIGGGGHKIWLQMGSRVIIKYLLSL